MSLNYMVNHLSLSRAVQNSNQGPMFWTTNGNFSRHYSEGTEKEHGFYIRKIIQITLKFNVSRKVRKVMALQLEET